ncbi:hypothetical protein [Streptomyces griseoviridis]|uniref:hypothetical protein n=1 Tax=Streptomyces griseoviridis TaxID=45398 RepID=UPI0013E2DCB3|nr:hypothetical protein [Streptomyces griseoviridis]
MLTEAWCDAKVNPGSVAAELAISRSTLHGWIGGRTVPSPERAPDFWALVRLLRRAPGASPRSDAAWEAALLAAQTEAQGAQHRQLPSNRRRLDPGLRFIGLHRAAPDVSTVEVRGRANERTVMNAFAQDSGPEAPSYLCWLADGPAGKTTLLADYVRRKPPADLDILTFFVSAAHGTDTRAEFEREIVDQIDALLGRSKSPGSPGSPVPRGTRRWSALFAEAAAKSARHGRNLLLVVDGLDDDVAWSDPAGTNGTPEPRTRPEAKQKGPVKAVRSTARGSIAGLLPAHPPPPMRVIVSLRRAVPLPGDVPEKRHPLRESSHLRTLLPVAGIARIRQPPPDGTALGEPVAGLLAVAGGGLRMTDLAELTGLSADHLDRLAHGPAGRALVTDDPVLRTYALADAPLVDAILADLAEPEVRRYTADLLAWSRTWRAAGWPDGTPPYPLTHQLRLLTDTAERAEFVLDLPRLRRLAHTAGPDVALAQLDAFEREINEAADVTSDADALATLVRLRGARSLLRPEYDADVPDGAAALFVRLGDRERARALARSAPTALARAVQLADVAVELALAGRSFGERTDLDAVVRETVEWLLRDRAHQGFPGAFRDPESYARLLCAAGTLARLNGPGVARPLFLAVLHDPAAGTAAVIEAAAALDAVKELRCRAETLSAGDPRARTAAVELYGLLPQVAPYLGRYAGDRIEAVCEELGDAEGLGAVDVLAAAASALSTLPAKRHGRAADQMHKALARMRQAIKALRDPVPPSDVLSEADRAHLRRELAGTLTRLAKAAADMDAKGDLGGIRRLMETLPEDLRVGVLDDPLLERAQWVLDTAEDDRARRNSGVAQAAAEKSEAERKAKRRAGDAERAAFTRQRMAHKARSARTPRPARTEPEDTQPPPPPRHTPAPRRPRPHRRSTGLLRPGDGPYPDRPEQPLLPLLLEADDQLAAGHLPRSRELLESALRSRHAVRPTNLPSLPESWTADLFQAMGAAGGWDEAEALAKILPGTPARARHLAALSLGCSLAGHDDPGARYARAAARLVPDAAAPDLANAVAQALAHAGDGPAATAMATGSTAAQRRHALTTVAAGLVRHRPEAAARAAGPLVEAVARRIDAGGSPLTLLSGLAALLLAFPDVRDPAPPLSDALRRTALQVADPSTAPQARTMAALALLARLGCLPDGAMDAVESAVHRWRHTLRPEPRLAAELALLAAVEGDTAAVRQHAETAPTPDDRARALGTAAAHLAGAHVALAVDSGAEQRVTRTCLVLARAAGDGRPPAEGTARRIALELSRDDAAWTRTIPLLPALAPGALGPLGAMGRDTYRPEEGAPGGGTAPRR